MEHYQVKRYNGVNKPYHKPQPTIPLTYAAESYKAQSMNSASRKRPRREMEAESQYGFNPLEVFVRKIKEFIQ